MNNHLISEQDFSHPARHRQSDNRPSLRPIDDNDLGWLQRALLTNTREDTYSQSASYLAMTGRNGLWLYSTDDTFMVISSHPNKDNHLLLFPPIDKQSTHLFKLALNDERIFIEQMQVQLARISQQDQLLLEWANASGRFHVEPEKLLDWRYPVHTLSTQAVINHQGRAFRNFRHGIHLAHDANLFVPKP